MPDAHCRVVLLQIFLASLRRKIPTNCDQFEINHLYFYFNDWPLVAEFWTALLKQLKKFPVKELDTFSRGLLGARMEDLREIWESCILEKLEVGANPVID